jgi:hypothetical protein
MTKVPLLPARPDEKPARLVDQKMKKRVIPGGDSPAKVLLLRPASILTRKLPRLCQVPQVKSSGH